jgi:hypothetical protein
MAPNLSLFKFNGESLENPSLYRTIVGALQYATITKPDIVYAVNKVSQLIHCPTTIRWGAVKRILRYLTGSISHGITLKPTIYF